MRPGLAFTGAALLVLAVAALVVVTFVPGGTHQVQDVSTIPSELLSPNATNYALLTGANTSQGSYTLTWTSTVPAEVRLYEVPGCRAASLDCVRGDPAGTWSGTEGGTWTDSGALGFPYLVVWNSSASVPGAWGLSAVETVSSPIASPWWQMFVIDAAGGALAVVGAVALFLGLFLRGGAFRGPAPLVSRSAEDAESIAGPPPPSA